MKPASLIATLFLLLVSMAQLIRFIFRIEVTAGGIVVPLWPSFAAFLFTGGLAVWLWRESRNKN